MTGSSSRRVLVCIGCLLIAVFAVACNDEDDPDAVADLECDELVEIIYDDCDTNLPLHDGAHPDRGDARTYCRDDQFYDWPASMTACSKTRGSALRWRCVSRTADQASRSANRS